MDRIAVWYDNVCSGRNDGNPVYIWAALKRRQNLGLLEVDHLAPTGNLKPFGKYDLNIWCDWGEDGLRDANVLTYDPVLPPSPWIYWASDTHLGFDYRLETAKKADIVFVAQKDAVAKFAEHGVKATWLPHAVEPVAYPRFNYAAKKLDVCFIGHINSENRIEAVDRLFRHFPNFFYGQRRFESASEKYCESKIVFNIAMKDDLNMRTFEAMGSGSFLLTDKISSIGDLFEDGKHLALYSSLDEMVDKATYYLSHDDEREKIARAGYEEVMAKHTIDHRLDTMLAAYQSLTKETVNV